GRRDDQVKIRGFRIELGEVERALMDCPGVVKALVTTHAEAEGRGLRLVGYVEAPAEVTAETLRAALETRVPAYMVPSYFVRLDRLPLNANGKIDRAALPPPAAHALTAA